MQFSQMLNGYADKAAKLTLVFLLTTISLTNQSCGVKLPSEVNDIVGKLSTDLPKLMSQAGGIFTPALAGQAQGLLDLIGQGSKLTKGGKTQAISEMFSKLGKDQVEPFFKSWKDKGKLDQKTIDTATKSVNDALGAIKKAGKIK